MKVDAHQPSCLCALSCCIFRYFDRAGVCTAGRRSACAWMSPISTGSHLRLMPILFRAFVRSLAVLSIHLTELVCVCRCTTRSASLPCALDCSGIKHPFALNKEASLKHLAPPPCFPGVFTWDSSRFQFSREIPFRPTK